MDFITKPFGWLMLVLYEFAKNYGLAVILFALVVKVILLPFQMKSKRGMMQQARLQPRLKELEKKHGANKQKLQEEQQKLYREEKINPMSGCLWSLLPFPIIIALFSAIRQPLTTMMGIAKDVISPGGAIYNKITELVTDPDKLAALTNVKDSYIQIKQTEFISQPQNFDIFHQISSQLHQINYSFLGMDLGQVPRYDFLWTTNWSDSAIWLPGLLLFLLPLVSGVLAYFSSKVSMQMNPSAGNQQAASTTKSMMLMMPVISIFFAFSMPGAIGVYIIASTLFAMIQDIILTKHYTKIMDAEDAIKNEQRRIRDEELEAKRLETERKKLENKTEVNPNTSKKKQQKSERQEQAEKAAEWEKKNTKTTEEKQEPGRIENRRFARGRAYDPERFINTAEAGTEEMPPLMPAAESAPEETAASEQAVYNPEEYSITFDSSDNGQDRTDTDEEK